MPRISARDNPRLAEAARLIASSRDRRKLGKCVLEGDHLVAVYMERIGLPETIVVVEEQRSDPRIAVLVARMAPRDVLLVNAKLFAEVAVAPADVGVLAVVATPRPAAIAPAQFHLMLDDVQDPGNVGTMLRTAAAAGVEQVLLSKACAFAWSPKVLRAAQGAHFLTTVIEDVDLVAWAVAFAEAGGRVVAATSHGARDLYGARIDAPWAVAIGNEGTGLSRALRDACTVEVSIPMPGGTESLNAAAAAAVVLFELVRRRRVSR